MIQFYKPNITLYIDVHGEEGSMDLKQVYSLQIYNKSLVRNTKTLKTPLPRFSKTPPLGVHLWFRTYLTRTKLMCTPIVVILESVIVLKTVVLVLKTIILVLKTVVVVGKPVVVVLELLLLSSLTRGESQRTDD